jgi:hypothetical protein
MQRSLLFLLVSVALSLGATFAVLAVQRYGHLGAEGDADPGIGEATEPEGGI